MLNRERVAPGKTSEPTWPAAGPRAVADR